MKDKMNSRQVRSAFNQWWRERCQQVPSYKTDKPAKRQAFSCFVDELHRDGRISDRVADGVTLEDSRYSVVLVQADGKGAYLSHRGRDEWPKRTAMRHLRDVSADTRYTSHYTTFYIEEA